MPEDELKELINTVARLYREGLFEEAVPIAIRTCELSRKIYGEDHPHFATSLCNLEGLYKILGANNKALPVIDERLQILRRKSSYDEPDYVQSLSSLALSYKDVGAREKALPLLDEARERLRRTSYNDDLFYSVDLKVIAGLYQAVEEYEKALPLFEEARELLRRTSYHNEPDYAVDLNNLAWLYKSLGAYEKALPLCEEAVGILRRKLGADDPAYALTLNSLAELYRLRGDYTRALPLLEEARGILRSALGEDHPDYAISLNNLAEMNRLLGDYEKALPLLEEARGIRRCALGVDHPDYAISLNNLAGLLKTLGAYEKALPLYEEAVGILRHCLGEDHPDYAASLNNLALLYQSEGKYEMSLPLLEKVRETYRLALGEDDPIYATSLNNLAILYQEMEDYEQAIQLLEEARYIIRRKLGEGHPSYALLLYNLALQYASAGMYKQALPLYEDARKIIRRVLGEDHPDYAASLEALARLHAAEGDVSTAYKLLESAVAVEDHLIGRIFGAASDAERTAFLLTLRGSLNAFLSLVASELAGRPDCVRAALDQVLRRKGLTAEALAIQREAVLGGRYPELAAELERLSTSRARNAAVVAQGPGPGADGRARYAGQVQSLEAEIARLEASLARQIPEMDLARRVAEADHRIVAHSLPPGARLVEFVRYTPYDFRAVPARGERHWQPDRYLVFVVPETAPDADPAGIQMIDLGEADSIDQLVWQHLDRIRKTGGRAAEERRPPAPVPRGSFLGRLFGRTPPAGPASSRDIAAAPAPEAAFDPGDEGRQLAAALLGPLREAIDGARHLLISPDGLLATLPFEVLPDDDGSLLIDRCLISYVSVGRDLVRVVERTAASPGPSLVIADPDYDLAARRGPGDLPAATGGSARAADGLRAESIRFGPLENTGDEGRSIGRMVGAEPLLREKALESVMKAARSPRLLHVATHGFFLPVEEADPASGDGSRTPWGREASGTNRLAHLRATANPLLRSGLALAGANTWLSGGTPPPEAEDGILTAEDVTGMDLSGTELVVLSACETGLGEVRIGDGVFGLRRSFAIAGAGTLVMSLWTVPDEETKDLMVGFYSRLTQGEGRAEALRNAQLAVRARQPHPFFWGAFICQGDTRALEE